MLEVDLRNAELLVRSAIPGSQKEARAQHRLEQWLVFCLFLLLDQVSSDRHGAVCRCDGVNRQAEIAG